jgi:hypothetical protein
VARVALLAVTVAACGWLVAAGPAQGAGPFPECAPGTPALPAPAVTAQGRSREAPSRIVAGRPFELTYDESAVGVQDTLAVSPGIAFDGTNVGNLLTVTVATPGAATFTVRYFDANATRANACVQSSTFTIGVEAGDPVVGRLGAIEGPEPLWPRGGPPRLPKKGLLSTGPPLVGTLWRCSATTGRIPVVAELFIERKLTRRPSESSPLVGRLTVPDPCGTQPLLRARAPGAILSFYGDPEEDGGERSLTAVTTFKVGARYWLRITQAGRLIGQARYYAAFRPAATRFSAIWVIAPQAAFERARCRRPPRENPSVPLGWRTFPIPRCPR